MSAAKPETPDDIGEMSFETALKELESIVEKLEAGEAGLEGSITLYERGERLKARCETMLKAAEAKIEKITLKPDGTAGGTTPLDVDG